MSPKSPTSSAGASERTQSTSPSLCRRLSYQNAPRTSIETRESKIGFIQHFIRLSIEGYESTHHEEYMYETVSDDGDSVTGYFLERSKGGKTCALFASSTLLVGSLLFFALFRFGELKVPHTQHSIYTGEAPVCDKGEQTIESLKDFASLDDIEHGAVAADHPKCSEIGLSILRDLNGNAADAAVATGLCLGVANPSSSGIGGGAFILVHAEDNTMTRESLPRFHDARTTTGERRQGGKLTEVIDCREVAGEAASTYMFEKEGVPSDASLFGGLAVAVPGELRGLELLHARHGKLDWETVARPAMELARDGIPVYPHLASDIRLFQRKQKEHGGLPTLRRLLTRNDDWGQILQDGELLKNLKLAETLQAVMVNGADAIYTGQRAEQLASEIRKAGGILTKRDFEAYVPTLRSPVVSDSIFGFRVVGVPPPSSGGAAIVGALRFLQGYASPLASFAETLSIHRMVEALKHVFAIRMSLSDPAFPVDNASFNATSLEAVDALIRGPYMEQLRRSTPDDTIQNLSHYGGLKFAQLNDTDGQHVGKDAKEGDRRRLVEGNAQLRRQLYDPFGYLEDHGTSHLSVVDKDGNAVAITTSVNSQFGSGLVSESTGIVLNNEMDGTIMWNDSCVAPQTLYSLTARCFQILPTPEK